MPFIAEADSHKGQQNISPGSVGLLVVDDEQFRFIGKKKNCSNLESYF